MKAFVLEDLDSEPRLDDLVDPQPDETEVLVRVQASAANPVDNAVAGGSMKSYAEYEFPVILGRDFAGVVEQAGSDASFAAGDEVFGFVGAAAPDVHNGSWAELARVPVAQAAPKPSGVDFASAGAAPVAALTAVAAIDALELQEGEPVLIIGAMGGVGCFAVQLAKAAGAHIIAPALPEDEGFLVDLGVDHVIPRDGDVVGQTRELEDGGGVAALIDTVSYAPDELDAYAAALADGGRAASPTRAAGEGPGRYNVHGSAEDGALERLGRLLADGLKVPIQRTYPLEEAGTALTDLQAKHTQGKLAVAVAA